MQLVVSLYHRTAERRASRAPWSTSASSDPLPFLCQFRVWDCVSDHMILVCRLHKVISGSAGVKERHYGEERARTKTADEKTLLRLSDKAALGSKFEDYRSLSRSACSCPTCSGLRRRTFSCTSGRVTRTAPRRRSWSARCSRCSTAPARSASPSATWTRSSSRKRRIHRCRRCTSLRVERPQKLSYSEGDVIQVLARTMWVVIGQLGGTSACSGRATPSRARWIHRRTSVLDATACLQTFRTGAKEPARSVSGFSNTLYVYPQALRLPKSKNVALRVRLCDVLDGRTNPIADKSFSRWDDQADGSVRSASESYLRADQGESRELHGRGEVDLPIVEDPRQYLVFTVLHINMQKPSRAGGGVLLCSES